MTTLSTFLLRFSCKYSSNPPRLLLKKFTPPFLAFATEHWEAAELLHLNIKHAPTSSNNHLITQAFSCSPSAYRRKNTSFRSVKCFGCLHSCPLSTLLMQPRIPSNVSYFLHIRIILWWLVSILVLVSIVFFAIFFFTYLPHFLKMQLNNTSSFCKPMHCNITAPLYVGS